jgi:mannose-6-phosphate isomerase-like protein (cupin superfamily)
MSRRAGGILAGETAPMPFADLHELACFSPDKMKKSNFAACPQFVADVYGLEPGQEQRVHAHAGEAKLYCVIEGRGDFTVGGEVRSLAAGEVAWAPAGVEHGVRNPYPARLTVLVVLAPKPNR